MILNKDLIKNAINNMVIPFKPQARGPRIEDLQVSSVSIPQFFNNYNFMDIEVGENVEIIPKLIPVNKIKIKQPSRRDILKKFVRVNQKIGHFKECSHLDQYNNCLRKFTENNRIGVLNIGDLGDFYCEFKKLDRKYYLTQNSNVVLTYLAHKEIHHNIDFCENVLNQIKQNVMELQQEIKKEQYTNLIPRGLYSPERRLNQGLILLEEINKIYLFLKLDKNLPVKQLTTKKRKI